MDAILATRTILLADVASGGIVSLVGQNVYGGQLPEHYNPEVSSVAEPAGDGPAITLIVKGGTTHAEIPLQEVDVQLTIWAGVNQNLNARAIYERCFQVLHGLCNQSLGSAGQVARILATVPGQDVVDADTGWATIIGAFNLMLIDTNQYPVNVQITPAETAAQYTDAAIAAISDIDGNGNFS
jgi:hypothetical protein